MSMKNRKELSAQYLLRINNIFKKNNWDIECTDDKNMSMFNRFCQRVLDIGENNKRDLFLELSDKYIYHNHINMILAAQQTRAAFGESITNSKMNSMI